MGNNYQWDFGVVVQFSDILATAVGVTFKLMVLVIVVAVPFGLLLALLRMGRLAPFRYSAVAVVEVTRAVPPLVWVVWFYYCLPILTGVSFSAITTVVVALALYTGVFFAEIFRAGLQSVDRGAIEAAYAGGMSSFQVLRRITGPIAFLRVFPPFTSQCVLVMKQTSLGSFVAIPELVYEGQRLSIHTFRPMEVLTTIAFCYAMIIVPSTLAANWMDSKIQAKYFRS
jgi:polar amino acid transport system permease protein